MDLALLAVVWLVALTGMSGLQCRWDVWWSREIREALLTSTQPETADRGLSAGSAGTDWHHHFRDCDQQVRGVVLVRAGTPVHPFDMLTPGEAAVSDFLKAKGVMNFPFLRLHMVDVVSLSQPRAVNVSSVQQVARGRFIKMTAHSFDALLAAQALAKVEGHGG